MHELELNVSGIIFYLIIFELHAQFAKAFHGKNVNSLPDIVHFPLLRQPPRLTDHAQLNGSHPLARKVLAKNGNTFNMILPRLGVFERLGYGQKR